MKIAGKYIILGCVLSLTACVKQENIGGLLSAGVAVLQATTLSEKDVKKTAFLSAKEMDKQSNVAPASSQYARRLQRLTKNISHVDGTPLNFKVYLNSDVNAFAMADGTVRVYSGLMDLMPDDQVLAVIGHEIGHVRLKHSYHQMKSQLLTNAAFQAAGSTTGALADFTSSQLGAVAYQAINSKYSQEDELEADQYALQFLRKLGVKPSAMKDSILTLKSKYGSGGGFLSSHPSNQTRIDKISEKL